MQVSGRNLDIIGVAMWGAVDIEPSKNYDSPCTALNGELR